MSAVEEFVKKRILIIAPQGIGDLVMLLPCLRILEFNNITFDILVKDRSSRDFIDELNFHNLYNIFILKEHLYGKKRY
jgi:ADP-heptose:LPS heptosyltransferase